MGHRVAILGASGYAGGELIRLVDGHDGMDIAYLGGHSTAGSTLGEVHPHLPGGDRALGPLDPGRTAGVDLAFLALPHGASAVIGRDLRAEGVSVVDLGADYRFRDPGVYESAYGAAHPYPEDLADWAYGLPELFRSEIVGSSAVAVPGCYPTSAILALAPLVREGVIESDGVVVDSLSGVTGAGRAATPALTFGAVDAGAKAYGVLTHRHRPEMEVALSRVAGAEVTLTFTPHLVPMQRGILTTCYANLAEGDPEAVLRAAYAEEPFVEVVDQPPNTRWVVGSNRCLISVHVDERTGRVVVLAAIDNLVKGAAGQAMQCANLMLGHDEASGLPIAGFLP